MTKLLDSDWLRAVQLKCNTSAKSVTPVQKVKHQCKLHIIILDYDLLKDNGKFCRPMTFCTESNDKNTETMKKVFSNAKNMASRNTFRHFFRAKFFMFVLLISSHTVLLGQFEINLHL